MDGVQGLQHFFSNPKFTKLFWTQLDPSSIWFKLFIVKLLINVLISISKLLLEWGFCMGFVKVHYSWVQSAQSRLFSAMTNDLNKNGRQLQHWITISVQTFHSWMKNQEIQFKCIGWIFEWAAFIGNFEMQIRSIILKSNQLFNLQPQKWVWEWQKSGSANSDFFSGWRPRKKAGFVL